MTTITLDRATVEQALEALVSESSLSAVAMQRRMDSITTLRAALEQQAERVEPGTHRVVAGALFDFMGWLTSRRERLVLSGVDNAAPAADAIKDFAEVRGLNIDDALVKEWQDNITAPPQRPPLTEEEIVDAVRDADLDWQAGWTLDEHEPNRFTMLARAIERKVRGEEK